MSAFLDDTIRRIFQRIDHAVESVRPFRAIVIGQSDGMVQIRRLHSTSGETALRARVVGFDIDTNDEVVCLPMADGIPLIVGRVQRATPSGVLGLPLGLRIGGSSGAQLLTGSGSPDGVVSAPIGSVYLRTDANNGNQLYVKVTGTGNRGWAPQGRAPRRRTVREIQVRPGASATTHVYNKGFANGPTITAASSANADSSTGFWLSHATSASSGNVASVVAGADSGVRLEWAPDLSVAFRSGADVSSVRYWVGLFSSSPASSDDPTIHGMGFRYSTNASDTTWQAWSNDNSGGGTITDTGVALNTGTAFDLRTVAADDGSAIDFYVSGNWVARHDANLPSAATSLDYGIYVTTLTAATRNIRWGRITLESRP